MYIEIGLDRNAAVEIEIWVMDCEHWAIVNGNILGYREELFGALRAVMQGLALFNIFITSLERVQSVCLIKLAEDIKLGGVSEKNSHWYRNNGK